MPNWCQNSIDIYADSKEKLEALIENGRMFENIIPLGTWDYNRAINEWGTKWDLGADDVANFQIDGEDGEYHLSAYFDTAWSPPIEVYKVLVEQGFVLRALYSEMGCGFMGIFDSEEGDYCVEIPDSHRDDYWNTPNGIEIDEAFCITDFLEECEELNMEND
jgi:hypothetical protein